MQLKNPRIRSRKRILCQDLEARGENLSSPPSFDQNDQVSIPQRHRVFGSEPPIPLRLTRFKNGKMLAVVISIPFQEGNLHISTKRAAHLSPEGSRLGPHLFCSR